MLRYIHAWEGMMAPHLSRFFARATPGDFLLSTTAAAHRAVGSHYVNIYSLTSSGEI